MQLKLVWAEDVARVKSLLGMTKDSIRSDVAALKDWLRKQPHLGPLTGVDEDVWLENYLLVNKNSLERTKANLDVYFSIRWALPEMFRERDMNSPPMSRSYANTCVAYMPGLTEEGQRVAVYAHFTDDSTDFHPMDVAKRLFAMADVYLAEGVDRVSTLVILDLKNTRVSHLAKYNPLQLKTLFDYGWKAYPERISAIHVINPPPVMEMVLNLFKPFIKQKVFNRIQIHSKVEGLREHIPPGSIPSEYGGLAPSCRDISDAWQAKLVESLPLLDTVSAHKSDEHLRPDKKPDSWPSLGVQGSFRQLSLD